MAKKKASIFDKKVREQSKATAQKAIEAQEKGIKGNGDKEQPKAAEKEEAKTDQPEAPESKPETKPEPKAPERKKATPKAKKTQEEPEPMVSAKLFEKDRNLALIRAKQNKTTITKYLHEALAHYEKTVMKGKPLL